MINVFDNQWRREHTEIYEFWPIGPCELTTLKLKSLQYKQFLRTSFKIGWKGAGGSWLISLANVQSLLNYHLIIWFSIRFSSVLHCNLLLIFPVFLYPAHHFIFPLCLFFCFVFFFNFVITFSLLFIFFHNLY